MIRREFLKLLGLAPIAAPLAAKSALSSSGFATGGFVSTLPGVFGEALLGESIVARSGGFIAPADFVSGMRSWNVRSDEAQSIEQQMTDHDLFERVVTDDRSRVHSVSLDSN